MRHERQVISDMTEEEWLAQRKLDLTSTDISVLFGVSKYKSAFQVWNEKRTGRSEPFKDTDRMKWGRRLEAAVAEGLAEDAGLTCEPFKDYIRVPDLRIGSSFDYKTGDGAILEIKTVDPAVFRSQWFEMPGGDYVAPEHIELQVQHQMLVAGIDKAYIGVLVGGNKDVGLLPRVADSAIQEQILQRAAEFWRSVDEESAPPVDFDNELDVKAVIASRSHAEPGVEIDATDEIDELAKQYIELSAEIKELDKRKESVKAMVLDKIGEAERVRGEGWTLSAKVQGPVEVSYTRKGFRNFKITKKRGK